MKIKIAKVTKPGYASAALQPAQPVEAPRAGVSVGKGGLRNRISMDTIGKLDLYLQSIKGKVTRHAS